MKTTNRGFWAMGLAAALAFASCTSDDLSQIVENPLGGDTGTRPGVFVSFDAAPGNPVTQSIKLKETQRPKVTFTQEGLTESAFLAEYVQLNTYDYEHDPLNLGPKNEDGNPVYTLEKDENGKTIPVYNYILSTEVIVPTSSLQIFSKWTIARADNALTGLLNVGDEVIPETLSFTVDERLSNITNAYFTARAVWRDDERLATAKTGLTVEMEAILDKAHNSEYDDEYFIGKGGSEYDELDAVMMRASSLALGEYKEMDVVVDNEYYINDQGGYLDSDGETLLVDVGNGYWSGPNGVYNIEALPLPVVRKIQYIDYDLTMMLQTILELQSFKDTVDFANYVPSSLSFLYDHNYHSITITKTGDYEIELYGASGGHVYTISDKAALGGMGGYVKGIYHFQKGDVIKVFVGGEGTGSGKRVEDTIVRVPGNKKYLGGFPNGGNGGQGHDGSGQVEPDDALDGHAPSGSGGGSTEIQLFGVHKASGDLQNNKASLGDAAVVYGMYYNNTTRENRLIAVAGGGGGAGQCGALQNIEKNSAPWPSLRGGNAGAATLEEASDPTAVAQNGVREGDIDDGHAMTETQLVNEGLLNWGQNPADKFYYSVKNYRDEIVWFGQLDGQQKAGYTEDGRGQNSSWPNRGAYEPSGGGGGGYKGGATGSEGGRVQISSGGGGTNYLAPVAVKIANGVSGYYGSGSAKITFKQ